MNLFVVGFSQEGRADPEHGARALRGLLERAGFLDPALVRTWRAPSGRLAAAWAQHPEAQTAGVRYVHADQARIALFSGRPYRWTGEEAGDGRGPLDAAHYLRPAPTWVDAMDGRWIAARCDDGPGVLEVASDAMGAHPLYRACGPDGTHWFGGNAEALRAIADDEGWDAEVLASLLAGGFSLTGHPWWRAVRRVRRGTVVRLADGQAETATSRLTAQEVARLPGAGFDAAAAGRVLVAALNALADWPGRPNQVPITAGRDSRLVFAAALHGDFEWEAVTAGVPGVEDVDKGRAVAAAAGVEHRIPEFDPYGNMAERPRRAAQVTALSSAGTACVADAAGFPLGPRDWVLPLWHSGHGSEVGRALYGLGEGLDRDGLVERLYGRWTTRRPGRQELVGPQGAAIVRRWFASFVDEQLGLGAAPVDVPDLFYFHQRLEHWAGPSHSCVEWIKDTTSPTWSPRLLGHELGLPARERALQLFHMRVLEALAPDLVDVPFEGDRPWPARQSAAQRRAARARTLARMALAEARRRLPSVPVGARGRTVRGGGGGEGGAATPREVAAGTAPGAAPADALAAAPPHPFAATLTAVREEALAQASHPAWEVRERPRVEALLTREPASLDPMSRAYVLRLATVFLREGG
ncbi:MAG: hypothetical protein ACXW08_07340, partial [Solirubrobacteraceae bacterium]